MVVKKLLTYNQIEKALENFLNMRRMPYFIENKCVSCEKITKIKVYKYIEVRSKELEFLPNCLDCIKNWEVTLKGKETYYEMNEQELFLVRLLC